MLKRNKRKKKQVVICLQLKKGMAIHRWTCAACNTDEDLTAAVYANNKDTALSCRECGKPLAYKGDFMYITARRLAIMFRELRRAQQRQAKAEARLTTNKSQNHA